MRRSSDDIKFPNSSTLFKFTHRVLTAQRGTRISNQDVGDILSFKPSDCSHWKRGAKNVRSYQSLEKLSKAMNIDPSILHDIVLGTTNLDEAFFEYQESLALVEMTKNLESVDPEKLVQSYKKIIKFVDSLHKKSSFNTPPLYILEILRHFSFINIQSNDMVDKLSRVLRIKTSKYMIHYKTGVVKPQVRLSTTKDLAKIFLEAERKKFKELGEVDESTIQFEKFIFCATLLCPKSLLAKEIQLIDCKSNLIDGLSNLFWTPRLIVNFQLKSLLSEKHLKKSLFTWTVKSSYRKRDTKTNIM